MTIDHVYSSGCFCRTTSSDNSEIPCFMQVKSTLILKLGQINRIYENLQKPPEFYVDVYPVGYGACCANALLVFLSYTIWRHPMYKNVAANTPVRALSKY